MRVLNDILSALDDDKVSVLLLLDLSAAFDTIDHQILLSRLHSIFGIHSTALQWFQSYLSNRHQSISVKASSSPPSQLAYGVPQGSVLGPVLFVLYTTPLSDVIDKHSVNHQLFADDTQLQKSAPLHAVDNLTNELQACTDDIRTWMTDTQLKLNDDKTEALLFSPSSQSVNSPLPDSIILGCHNIPFSDSARNLGFILDARLSMMKHIIPVCQTLYFELRRISSIHIYLTEHATKTPVKSCILSRLDYCNCLLMGAPNSAIQPLQKVQNSAARLILKAPRHHEWFCSWTFSELLNVYTRSRTLRSSSDSRMLKIPQYKRKTFGFRCFSYHGPHIWNSLLRDIRHCSTFPSFKTKLKTFLFSQYFDSS